MVLAKPLKPNGEQRIRAVLDKHEQNANTRKIAAPLPDMHAILRNVARHRYQSLLDAKDVLRLV
jgi:hypothetical protein